MALIYLLIIFLTKQKTGLIQTKAQAYLYQTKSITGHSELHIICICLKYEA